MKMTILGIALSLTLLSAAAAGAESRNLALGASYFSAYPSFALPRWPDTGFKELTDGKRGSGAFADLAWQGRNVAAGKPYWMTVDLVYESSIDSASLSFLELPGTDIRYPSSVRFSASRDGQVYEYIGDATAVPQGEHRAAYSLKLRSPVIAKAIRAVVGSESAGRSFIDELEVFGSCAVAAPGLIAGSSTYGEAEGSATQVVDLGSDRNVSVIDVTGSDAWYSTVVSFDTAASRGKYVQLGLASPFQNSKKGSAWRLSIPYTVKARSLKLTYIGSESKSHVVSVYGQSLPVAEAPAQSVALPPPAPFAELPDSSNVAKGKAVSSSATADPAFPDKGGALLCDGRFGDALAAGDGRWAGYRLDGSTLTQVLDLGAMSQGIVGIGAEFMRDDEAGIAYPARVAVSASLDGTSYAKLGDASPLIEVMGKEFFRLDFPAIAARYVKLELEGAGLVLEDEIQVYQGSSPKPKFNGGFIQIPIASADPLAKYTEAQWRREVELAKGLGMDYVIVQYGADSHYRESLYPRPSLAGYAQSSGVENGYGCPDPIEAIMRRCDELGMKVVLGGVVDYNTWYTVQVDDAWIRGQVAAGIKVIDDLDALYAGHPSFYGYYLADETCDEWLAKGQWARSRALYLGQSERIRKIRPAAKILISPAAWRSTDPETFADDLYKCVERGSDRPIVDMILIQDCLGRPNAMGFDQYQQYEEREYAIAKMCRERIAYPGKIQFWNDAEVFVSDEEWTMWGKGAREMERQLALDSKYTNVNVCFDLSHYLLPQSSKASFYGTDQSYCDYAEYLKGLKP